MTADNRPPFQSGALSSVIQMIDRIKVGLLTTLDRHNYLHCRPVQTLRADNDGALWFFTDWRTTQSDEIQEDQQVSLSYADPRRRTYVVVNGFGSLRSDPRRAKELWIAGQRAFYPGGPTDSRLAVLRVRIERAEYWIAPGRLSSLATALKAAATGQPVRVLGENRKIHMDRGP